jgi:hypothetical protein
MRMLEIKKENHSIKLIYLRMIATPAVGEGLTRFDWNISLSNGARCWNPILTVK